MSEEPNALRAPLSWLKSRFGQKSAPLPERRSTPRQRIRFEADLGKSGGSLPAVGVDIHEDGARVLAHEGWEVGTVLFLTLKEVQLGGFAEVRHCSRRTDGRYSIGLAFRGPLVPQGATWQIQRVHAVAEPWTPSDDKGPVAVGSKEVA